MWRKTMRYRAVLAQGPTRMAESVAVHEQVMAAVERRDPLATEQAVRSLIMNARDALIDWLRSPNTLVSVSGDEQNGEAAM